MAPFGGLGYSIYLPDVTENTQMNLYNQPPPLARSDTPVHHYKSMELQHGSIKTILIGYQCMNLASPGLVAVKLAKLTYRLAAPRRLYR